MIFNYHAQVPHSKERTNIGGHTVMAMWYLHKRWCVEHVGYRGELWDSTDNGNFYFEREQDRNWFVLRWAS